MSGSSYLAHATVYRISDVQSQSDPTSICHAHRSPLVGIRSHMPNLDTRLYLTRSALGDRARKLDKGILITRFELPFK